MAKAGRHIYTVVFLDRAFGTIARQLVCANSESEAIVIAADYRGINKWYQATAKRTGAI